MTSFSLYTSLPSFSGVTKEKAVAADVNNTDVIAPEFRLYIEGVQVPFESISINQSYNTLPTATIQIPPESGLLDITRGYEPKVHIFYKDDNYGGFRLLFWGHIKGSNYSRSRSQGSTYISFSCEHKNALLNQVTLDYSGWANPNSESLSNPNSANAAFKPPSLNSPTMVIQAMSGVSGVASESEILSPTNSQKFVAPTDKLDPSLAKFESRLTGIPGVAVNLWNQIRKGVYVGQMDNITMSGLLIPMVEEGLSFFKRLSGHPYLENKLQNSKSPYCHTAGNEVNILIPPCSRVSLSSAVQRELTVKNVQSMVGFSGELTSYYKLMSEFMSHCKYDVNTLASPAEVNIDPAIFIEEVNSSGVEKVSIETILKPQIPFYFSPTCNVILPRMFMSIQVSQDEASTPTRIAAIHDAMPVGGSVGSPNTTFNSPPSIREAIAYNALLKGVNSVSSLNLRSTLAYTYSIPGKYEQGVGVRPSRTVLPWWLALLTSDKELEGKAGNQEESPQKGTDEYNQMMALTSEWRSRYGSDVKYEEGKITFTYNPAKKDLNPNDPENKSVLPYQRIMFSTLDYEFSERVAGSRLANIEAVFNPYIIPGYPMDVIDDSPNHPSFHGYCTSVTHSISSRSVVTNISMVSATTYAELSNFYTPSVSPFLQTALGLVSAEIDQTVYNNTPAGDASAFTSTASTLLQNPAAKEVADTFYRQVLGVGAAAPDDLIHFSSGRAFPLFRKSGILIPKMIAGSVPDIKPRNHYAREKDDYYSTVGNLRLVSRPIESKESISSKFGYNFIDLNRDLYNTSFVNYVNPVLASNLLLEPGASLFLDYLETEEFINLVKSRLNI